MLGRALDVLAAFRAGEAEVSLSELSRRSGVTKPTALRLLRELTHRTLVERTANGYRLGLGLFELGQNVPRQRDLLESAVPILTDLHEATRETVHLAVPDGTDVVYLQKLSVTGGPQIPSRLGGRMPAHCTGVGKVLLAFGAPGLLDAVLARGMPRCAPRSVTAPGLLTRQLAEIRRRGWAEEHEESAPGVACAAAPVLGPDDVAVAAISITGWSNRFTPSRVVPAVRTAALGLSRTFGGSAAS